MSKVGVFPTLARVHDMAGAIATLPLKALESATLNLVSSLHRIEDSKTHLLGVISLSACEGASVAA